MENVMLGKIKRVRFGLGGYQDLMIGLHLELGGNGWGTSTSIEGFWDPASMKRSPHALWTEEERKIAQTRMVNEISQLMRQAKVTDVMKLMDKPVEIIFEKGAMKSWRILTEVL